MNTTNSTEAPAIEARTETPDALFAAVCRKMHLPVPGEYPEHDNFFDRAYLADAALAYQTESNSQDEDEQWTLEECAAALRSGLISVVEDMVGAIETGQRYPYGRNEVGNPAVDKADKTLSKYLDIHKVLDGKRIFNDSLEGEICVAIKYARRELEMFEVQS